ncbi:DUF1214 domain-containing protein [Sphingomonas daechungensis]|uniref:DUF1214 domain-containing protein n=1 Tax=Sphingomonas daechungensis TaxID=1176646 RepID=UPI003784DFD9
MNGEQGITVTSGNFVEADVDLTFAHIVNEVGTNNFRHDRTLIPLDKQPAVTMNRDTVYSFGAFYAPTGTTVTLPVSKDGRYQSAMIIQTDHYIDQVFYGPGTFEIVAKTEFVGIAVRTQVDATDRDDVKYVNQLQDQIVVTWPDGVTPKEYKPRKWDMPSLLEVRTEYQKKAAALPNLNATSGARGTVDPELQKMGVSVALGLLPPEHAVYVYRDFGLKGDRCYAATYAKPKFGEGGFFSFTMYGSDKLIHNERSTLNNRVIKDNPDGTFTIHYGPKDVCGDVLNWLETPGDNWYLGLRVYRPDQAIVAHGYDMPVPVEAT